METIKKFFRKIAQLIEKIENLPISLSKFLLAFFCFVFLRNFLETFSVKSNYFGIEHLSFFFFHSVAFYIFVFLALIIILHFVTKEKIVKVSKVIFFGSIVLLMPPLLDLLASGGGGVINKYRDLAQPENIWQIIKLFFGYIFYSPFGLFFKGDNSFSLAQIEINYGIRIEVLIVFLFIIWFIFWKTKNILRVLLGLFLSYLVFFVLGIFPYFWALVFGLSPNMTSFSLASSLNPLFTFQNINFSLYFIFILIFSLIWFYLYNKHKFVAVIKNLRPLRLFNNLIFLLLGLLIALHFNARQAALKPFDYLLVFIACLAVVFYWLFAVFSNDLADEKGDRINAPTRPLLSGALSHQETRGLSFVFLGLSYMLSVVAGYSFFVVIFLRSCLSYLYSWPPFRLKRIPLLSSFFLATGYFLTMLAGYLLLSSNTVFNFPGRLALVFLVGLTTVINFKDIKDYEGDKVDKVYTLPVIFGVKRGKLIIGFLGAFAFLLLPLVYREYLKPVLIPSLVTAAVYFYLTNRKRYNEKLIFLLIFAYVALIVSIIW